LKKVSCETKPNVECSPKKRTKPIGGKKKKIWSLQMEELEMRGDPHSSYIQKDCT